MRELIAITKALADETRLRLLMALRSGELCVCQLTELVGLASSTVSKHLSILHQARLVDVRRDGRWSYYRLTADDKHPEAADAINWIVTAAKRTHRIREDTRHLKAILKTDPEELCRTQAKP